MVVNSDVSNYENILYFDVSDVCTYVWYDVAFDLVMVS